MDLNLLLNRAWPGDTVTLTIFRDGKKMDVPVKLGEG
jgi:S1-C subfamily serine protease